MSWLRGGGGGGSGDPLFGRLRAEPVKLGKIVLDPNFLLPSTEHRYLYLLSK